MWCEDEWLTDIYDDPWLARSAVERGGEGRPWDNDRELQITRCYRKRINELIQGEEIPEGHPAVCEKAWARYAEFPIKERGEDNGVMDR